MINDGDVISASHYYNNTYIYLHLKQINVSIKIQIDQHQQNKTTRSRSGFGFCGFGYRCSFCATINTAIFDVASVLILTPLYLM